MTALLGDRCLSNCSVMLVIMKTLPNRVLVAAYVHPPDRHFLSQSLTSAIMSFNINRRTSRVRTSADEHVNQDHMVSIFQYSSSMRQCSRVTPRPRTAVDTQRAGCLFELLVLSARPACVIPTTSSPERIA